jgi:small subunit ribosomal protein S10
MASQIIRIKLRSFDSRLLDTSVSSIVDTARTSGAKVAGPIPLPTHIQKFTVNRSPNGDKKSREQFEMRTHKRVIDLIDPPQKTLDELQTLDLPAGVHVQIKLPD